MTWSLWAELAGRRRLLDRRIGWLRRPSRLGPAQMRSSNSSTKRKFESPKCFSKNSLRSNSLRLRSRRSLVDVWASENRSWKSASWNSRTCWARTSLEPSRNERGSSTPIWSEKMYSLLLFEKSYGWGRQVRRSRSTRIQDTITDSCMNSLNTRTPVSGRLNLTWSGPSPRTPSSRKRAIYQCFETFSLVI